MSSLRRTLRRRSAPDGARGYTLVELLVVLAILGLLAAIATPQVIKYLNQARFKTAKTEIESLSTALDLYKFDIGRYPTTQEGLNALVTAPPDSSSWNGPYVKKNANLIDPWNHTFHYQAPGQHGEYDIFSYGPDADNNGNGEKPAITSW